MKRHQKYSIIVLRNLLCLLRQTKSQPQPHPRDVGLSQQIPQTVLRCRQLYFKAGSSLAPSSPQMAARDCDHTSRQELNTFRKGSVFNLS